jgi:hypothetical protein
MYSAVMTYLGQNTQPNILLNATVLQNFTAGFTGLSNPLFDVYVGPALDSFSALKDETGPLGASPAVILTKYFCQIPKRKSVGSLMVTILAADLVFLQVLWKIFHFIVERVLEHEDPTGMYWFPGSEKRTG